MSILLADSGSTKTEWVLLKDNLKVEPYYTEGLNPYFKTYQELVEVIDKKVALYFIKNSVEKIYFYGAGCGTEENRNRIKEVLKNSFEGAEIEVGSDLLCAAIACFGHESGLACILGTGSNSCLYDGGKIIDQIPSLGFTLGDEGSGGYFGKRIIRSYFYNEMPEDLKVVLREKYDMSLAAIREKVYNESNSNRFVASFSILLGEYKDHLFIQNLVREGFTEFVDKQLGYFGDLSSQKIGFVGSIASIHQEILTEVLGKKGLQPDIIIQKPMERLVEAHKLKVRKSI
ncbi:MAG: hypothetical protein RLN90_02950 [Balneolaceae bacterium]